MADPEVPADPLEALAAVARDPGGYIARWRQAHPGRPVVGVFPMNFPREIAHAAGTLPVVVQEDREPVTAGRNLLAEFYCGYTRNLADQVARGRLAGYDAFFLADHCISLIGAVDIIRSLSPATPVFFGMLISSMSDSWAPRKVHEMMSAFRTEFEEFTGSAIDAAALRASIAAHNENRQLLRSVFDDRRAGARAFTAAELQHLVKSAMIMDPAEHTALLRTAITAKAAIAAIAAPRPGRPEDSGPAQRRVRVHLSGHLCHAPRPELLDLIEECGAVVVDDDLYHGLRYISTDIPAGDDPITAVSQWYSRRNVNIPCPTRVQHDVDWDQYLLRSVAASGAEAVIVLMPKFCEPHMLYYPELRKAFDAAGLPYLLIETEHEGMPMESIRTRMEALIERVRRRQKVSA